MDDNCDDAKKTGLDPRPLPSKRPQLMVCAVLTAIAVVGLALGLGLGLGLKHGQGEGTPGPSPSATHSPAPSPTALWQPAVNVSWQIVLNQALAVDDTSSTVEPDVEVFDIDMFLHQNTSVVKNLHRLGKKVICYFSAGTYEPNRPDSSQFQSSDQGKALELWPDERWLNLSSPSVRSIMVSRIQIASDMGCDAIDPDNVDGYQWNNNGLDLTSIDSIKFVKFLTREANKRNLSVGLKNADDIITDVLSYVQFAVNEECADTETSKSGDTCQLTAKFIQASKPVFHIEYPASAPTVSSSDSKAACSAPDSTNFSTVLKTMDLSGWVEFCNGQTANTSVVSG
ncbi:glycoside hydrolase superfamily [Podospora didyma]|uniref:alpha-galactosidase n=1 Tax=Podospora didyma TaxID=330526 RepID=A0AAE0P8P4_9PEZI|nr:glycoside hydrolase superfamily [Podospora didyma]